MQFYKIEPKRDKWGKHRGEIIDELLRKEGLNEYATFGFQDEGGEMPTGLETAYILVLTPDEKIWGYFLDWDSEKLNPDGEKGYYKLREPRDHSGGYQTDHGYIRARKQLNLPITEEQEKILQKWEEENKPR